MDTTFPDDINHGHAYTHARTLYAKACCAGHTSTGLWRLFTPNDSVTVTVTLTGGTFDLFDGHCDRQNGLHTHFACQCNICYGDGIAWCARAFGRSRYILFSFKWPLFTFFWSQMASLQKLWACPWVQQTRTWGTWSWDTEFFGYFNIVTQKKFIFSLGLKILVPFPLVFAGFPEAVGTTG